MRGACIFIQEDQNFTTINLQKFCEERGIEIVAIQVKFNKEKVIIVCVYRAPSGDYDYFLNKLDCILHSLHRYNSEFIQCGDININININYLESNSRKIKLEDMLNSYNLKDAVYFPTRITNNSATLIDNIFIDNR
jgi:exonuclease III